MGPDQFGVVVSEEAAVDLTLGQGGVCASFGDAKAALIRSLAGTRDAYAEAVREIRALRKRDVS
jgi:hypothetical protein